MNWLTVRYAAEVVALLVLLLLLVDSLVTRAARGWHCRREWQVLEDLPPVNGVWIECTEEELLYITRLEMVWGVSRSDAARVMLYRGGLQDGEQVPAQINSAEG